jgi:peroxisomal membrane protein 4
MLLNYLNYIKINMYLLSRILFGLTRLAQEKNIIPQMKNVEGFRIFSGIVWSIGKFNFQAKSKHDDINLI